MNWLGWFLIGYLVVSAAVLVANIGKPRTKGEAVGGVIEVAVVIGMIAILVAAMTEQFWGVALGLGVCIAVAAAVVWRLLDKAVTL